MEKCSTERPLGIRIPEKAGSDLMTSVLDIAAFALDLRA